MTWRKILLAFILCLLFVAPHQAPCGAAVQAMVQLEPNVLSIGATYNGATIRVSGEIPHDAQVIVRVSGHRQDINLSQKGKVFGLLWMNTGEVSMHDAPNLYMLYLPGAYSGSSASATKPWQTVGVGFEALRRQIKITADTGDANFIFDEFVKLKQHEGLYAIHENTVNYGQEQGVVKIFSCDVFMPPRIRQGTYEITAIVVKDGKKLGAVSKQLAVRLTGFPKLMDNLAFGHGTLYGILASVIALLAGLLMSLVFRGAKGAH